MIDHSDRSSHPPRAANWLLGLFFSKDQITPILGDLVEEFSAVVLRKGVRSAQRWYWRQSVRTVFHLFDAQLRIAPWQSLAALIAGLLLMWIANMPLLGGYLEQWPGDWPDPLRLAWMACAPMLPFADLIFPPLLIAWAIARMSTRREMVITMMLSVTVAAARLIAVLHYDSVAGIPAVWSPFWLADPTGVVACPIAILAGGMIARKMAPVTQSAVD
ncbi:MAG TPA: permease prefix domain 2-containing transporter [Candidatus Sulfopaludibacter sp.]|nr:permease prefix domain 2-containing transporter [Candidatus Sulfopaludibacter sp.]